MHTGGVQLTERARRQYTREFKREAGEILLDFVMMVGHLLRQSILRAQGLQVIRSSTKLLPVNQSNLLIQVVIR